MAFSDLASSLYIVLLNMNFTTMASNSHKNDTNKSYERRRKEPPARSEARVAERHWSDSMRILKLSMSGVCTVKHARANGVAR